MVVLVSLAFSLGAATAESPATSVPPTSASLKRLVVWDGEQAAKGAGWANPKPCSIGPQTAEAHSGDTALEFKFQGGGDEWLGAGWNWCAFQTGPYGTDITAFKSFTFWMKTKGKVTDPQINLLCNGEKFDLPEHHTEKVSVLNYCSRLLDGKWHQVTIPLADFNPPKGFDPLHVGEVQMFNAGEGDGSFFMDDIGFDDPVGDQHTAALAPAPATAETLLAKSAPFVWKGDCSSEAAFVNSHHPTIPGHYEYLPDPNEPARGLVFAGHLTPDFTTTDPEKFHLHPEIYFNHFIPGNITLSFDVKVDDLAPSELGPYGGSPWLNVVTLFDETTVAGAKSFHPSVMVNLVGTPGHYRLQAYSIDAAGTGTFYEKIEGGPVFPTGKWVTVRVEADVQTKQVRVYQDKRVASAGSYLGKPGLAGAHMGLYANRKMTRATVFNDDITITVGE